MGGTLDMDGSGNTHGTNNTNMEHVSVGGGSLCQIFDQDESLQRALREDPSWERSMRSRSPLSMASVDGGGHGASYIRARDLKLLPQAHLVPNPASKANQG